MPAGAPPPRPVGSSAPCPKPHLVPFLCAHRGIRFVGFTPPSAGPPGHSGPLVVRVGLDRVLLRVLREVAPPAASSFRGGPGVRPPMKGRGLMRRGFSEGICQTSGPRAGRAGLGPDPVPFARTAGGDSRAGFGKRLTCRGSRSGESVPVAAGGKRGFPSDRALSAAGFADAVASTFPRSHVGPRCGISRWLVRRGSRGAGWPL
jgi:hypothetical protein